MKVKIYFKKDNPYSAAELFCLENELPNYFASEITQHILQNVPGINKINEEHLLNQKKKSNSYDHNPYHDVIKKKKSISHL
jgi:hypothetical protein